MLNPLRCKDVNCFYTSRIGKKSESKERKHWGIQILSCFLLFTKCPKVTNLRQIVTRVVFHAGALPYNVLMTFLMHNDSAHLALIALLANHTPDEIFAVRAERRLSQIRCHEFVTGDLLRMQCWRMDKECASSHLMDLSTHCTATLSLVEGVRFLLEHLMPMLRVRDFCKWFTFKWVHCVSSLECDVLRH